jgi:hypothetical protein
VAERLTGRWLFLVLRNAPGSESVGLSELRFYGRPGTAPTVEYIEGDGLEDRRITIRGNLVELNAALAAVTYQLDPGYNSGNPQAGNVVPDRLLVTLTDRVDGVIGTHVPVDPGTLPTQPSTVTETVLVTVQPKNDPPTVDLSGALGAVLDEDTSLVLGPIAVGDPDEPDDPLWQGQVTLSMTPRNVDFARARDDWPVAAGGDWLSSRRPTRMEAGALHPILGVRCRRCSMVRAWRWIRSVDG